MRDPGGFPSPAAAGEDEVVLGGVAVRPGAKLRIRLPAGRTAHDQLLDGRLATLERIYRDYEDRVYLGVTLDDGPAQELLRETGRYLFFFAGEVEVAQA